MDIEQIKSKTSKILQNYGIKKAALFGSYSRKENSENSDVDILVELGKKMSLFDFVDLKLDLEDVLNKKVDLLQYKKIKPSLKKFILKDEKVFFKD